MTRDMGALAAAACLLTAAALPAAADAARFRGTTQQGRFAGLRTGADGRVKRVTIKWQASCRHGVFRRFPAVFVRPFDFGVPGRFSDGSPPRLRVRLGGGMHAIVRNHVRGHVGAHGNWRGTFRVDVGVFRGTRRIDTCHLHDDDWHAKRVS
jgi:hypothetical protein